MIDLEQKFGSALAVPELAAACIEATRTTGGVKCLRLVCKSIKQEMLRSVHSASFRFDLHHLVFDMHQLMAFITFLRPYRLSTLHVFIDFGESFM